MGHRKRNLVALAAIATILVIGIILFSLMFSTAYYIQTIPVSEAIYLAKTSQVQKIVVDGNKFTVILHDGTRLEGRTAQDEDLREDLRRAGVENVDALFSDP